MNRWNDRTTPEEIANEESLHRSARQTLFSEFWNDLRTDLAVRRYSLLTGAIIGAGIGFTMYEPYEHLPGRLAYTLIGGLAGASAVYSADVIMSHDREEPHD